ncbi:MAG: ERAP1-like C-terminal domain-containing protein, partial [Nocardioides sp.]
QGRYDEQVVADLLARDPDPDSAARAVAVTAARPDAEAKAEAWRQLFEVRSVQSGYPTYAVSRAFWRPGQDDVLAPYADGYLDQMRDVRGGLLSMLALVRGMFPLFAGEDFVARARETAERPATDPTVRGQLLTGADTLQRMLRARG